MSAPLVFTNVDFSIVFGSRNKALRQSKGKEGGGGKK